jgi:hypothetical protein
MFEICVFIRRYGIKNAVGPIQITVIHSVDNPTEARDAGYVEGIIYFEGISPVYKDTVVVQFP